MGIDRFPGSENSASSADKARSVDDSSQEIVVGDEDPSAAERTAYGRSDQAGDWNTNALRQTLETETKQAELRTRDEYADVLRHTDATPVATDHSSEDGSQLPEPEYFAELPAVEDQAGPPAVVIQQETKHELVDVRAHGPQQSRGDMDANSGKAHLEEEQLGVDDESESTTSSGTNQESQDFRDGTPDPSTESQDLAPPKAVKADESADEPLRPLTDQEWSEHVRVVDNHLKDARVEGFTTKHLYTIDSDRQIWSSERNRLQSTLVAELYDRARDIPCDHKALIAGGLGGAGKTTVLAEQARIDRSQYLTINPDDIKEEMARRDMIPEISGLSPMEVSDLAHEESSHIAKRLAIRAMTDGKNVIWDITMSSLDSTGERIVNLRQAGYSQIDGLFVNIPIETSIQRTDSRHREGHEKWRAGSGPGGRYVPPEVIQEQEDPEWGCQNRRTFESLKNEFDSWSIYDNSIDGGTARLIDSGNRSAGNQSGVPG